MRRPCCHTFTAFILKTLIFFQTFIGISIILYSVYMLTQWNKHLPPSPPSPSPSPPSEFSPAPSPDSFDSGFNGVRVFDQVVRMYYYSGDGMVYDGVRLYSDAIPTPWFIYAFMGLGVILVCISCIGHIAAEAIHGCCLCFYTVLKIILILLEVALVAFIALDQRWEKDFGYVQTTSTEVLKSCVFNEPFMIDATHMPPLGLAALFMQGNKRMPGTAVTKSIVANEPGGRKREEIFVDIIEKISVTFSSSVSTKGSRKRIKSSVERSLNASGKRRKKNCTTCKSSMNDHNQAKCNAIKAQIAAKKASEKAAAKEMKQKARLAAKNARLAAKNAKLAEKTAARKAKLAEKTAARKAKLTEKTACVVT